MRTLAVSHFLRALAKLPASASILVAGGGFGVAEHTRIGILELDRDNPAVLEDGYLATARIDDLLSELRAAHPGARVRAGGWNTMHATGWTCAWTDDGGPFELLTTGGRIAQADGDWLLVRGESFGRQWIQAVEPYVAEGWVRRGVRLRLRDGSAAELVHEDDPTPALDFTYDGLNLLADTGWLHELAGAVSRAVGAPVVDCTG
jgi:hypothetical protein